MLRARWKNCGYAASPADGDSPGAILASLSISPNASQPRVFFIFFTCDKPFARRGAGLSQGDLSHGGAPGGAVEVAVGDGLFGWASCSFAVEDVVCRYCGASGEVGDYFFGINGIVSFKNSKLSEILPVIGLDRILLETDAPIFDAINGR